MCIIFGDFLENFPPERDSLELTFMPSSHSIKQRWRNNRISAHFVADYLSTFLPIEDEEPNKERRIHESKGAISYIANELLENAMKFNDQKSNHRIRFGIHFVYNPNASNITAIIFTTNSISSQTVEILQDFIKKLLSSDPSELYIHQIEKNAAEENNQTSGLGLITIVNDYAAKVGWKFETLQNDPEIITVTTMVQIQV